jgi:CHASE1-domain containing sensor protein
LKNSKIHHWRSSVFFLPWIVLVLSLGLSVVLYYEAWHLVKGKERVYFERQTSKIKEDIINRLDKYVAVLRGGQGLFAASNNVERQEWNNFVRVLDVEQNYPGLVSLSFVDFIPERERDGFIKKTRANDIPNFQTWPQKGRGDAFINIYSEPLNTLRPVLGFDMSSEPKRKEALETARDTGLAAISAKLTLMNVKGSNKTGFVLTIPVYKNDLPHATLIERRTNIQGWIVAGLQSQDFMDSVSNDAANEIDFEIFDGQNMTTESVLHDEDQILHAVDGSYHPAFQEKATIVVGGRPWTLYFTTRSSFGHAVDEAIPAIVLLGGFVASILLF